MDDEYEPSNVGNFLNRYHSWRNQKTSPPTSPPMNTRRPSNSRSADVWAGVFQPYGRSPTGASRYDNYQQTPSPELSPGGGSSLSEIHDLSKMKQISLDEPRD